MKTLKDTVTGLVNSTSAEKTKTDDAVREAKSATAKVETAASSVKK